jgi:UDP-3-O-[3-hydroxymyristoyl] N-acetylglucosamine deacetylase
MRNQDIATLRHQRSIAAPIQFVGIGIHSGERVHMSLQPAAAGQGIQLVRRDLPAGEQHLNVDWASVRTSQLCTVLVNEFGHEVSTVEHLLSALAALGIDNVTIELDGPEIPIMDGSAMPFVDALESTGIVDLGVAREVIVITRPVCLQQGASWARLVPDSRQRITVSIDFDARIIGTQTMSIDLGPSVYCREIAPARTFGFADQLERLWRQGLALGGSIKNAILVKGDRVANLEGLRFHDEFVRHKVLDVIGDLALAGRPIIGRYEGHRPGHQLNTDLVALLMQDRTAWQTVTMDALDEVLDQVVETDITYLSGPTPGAWRPEPRLSGPRVEQALAKRIRRLFGTGR